jgi:hypothetical protein
METTTSQTTLGYAPGSIEHLLSFYVGDWNNSDEYWKAITSGASLLEKPPHVFLHLIPLEVQGMGKTVFFAQGLAIAEMTLNYPYLLSVYEFLHDEQGRLVSRPHSVDIRKYQQAHLDPSVLKSLTREELIERSGCDCIWTFDGTAYQGSVGRETTCAARYAGSSSMTVDITLSETTLVRSDNFFDAEGKKLSGSPITMTRGKARMTNW